ncbi:polysaccharide biosynthesis tyrosine autokinase [Blastococcus sp. TF02A-26]|uniref:polysaccharide biosynthesis tyrosine autokinase n=1 Tax=Blastococcus sp. TF02A-26 TaxID=2250577 RepID=UPI000DE9408E|nr:polysaccharide biosynthesis tyrosine autokinase [Blastococcus sp. TF02A-26]RBY86138.1 hypothetical protein DQ240_10045 [Blastococcus sp. TF02A-26]
MGFVGYLMLLRRRAWGVAASVVLGVGSALVLSLLATPVYTSTATLFFSLQNGDTASDLAQGGTFTRDQIASYATLATTPTVLDPVIERLDLDVDAVDLAGRVSAAARNETVVLEISVDDTDPEQAAAIARAVSDQLIVAVEDVAPEDSEGRTTARVTTVSPAQVPTAPSSPDTALNVLAGLVGGVALGLLYAWLCERLDNRVRSAEDLERITDLPLLATLDTPPGADGRRDLVVVSAPRSAAAEAIRSLRTAVQFTARPGQSLTLLVTSANSAEGKSTVAANLAVSLSETGLRVALVDADLRRPSVAQVFDLEGAAGLTTVLIGQAELDDVLQEWGASGLHVLATGPLPPNPSELLSSPGMAEVLERLGRTHDVVLVDGAPLLPVTDSSIVARLVSGTIVVGDASRTRRPALVRALGILDRVEARVVGVVLTHVRQRAAEVYGYEPLEPAEDAEPLLSRLRRRGRVALTLLAGRSGQAATAEPEQEPVAVPRPTTTAGR